MRQETLYESTNTLVTQKRISRSVFVDTLRRKNRWRLLYPAACNIEVTFVPCGVQALALLKQFTLPSNIPPAHVYVTWKQRSPAVSFSSYCIFVYVC